MTATTPQLAPGPVIAPTALLAVAHLSSEQLDALLSASSADRDLAAAEAHLLLCEACVAELANLRDSLSLFRQATSAHANRQLQGLPPLSIPTRTLLFSSLQPAHWVAAAAMLMIALLPIQTLRQRALQSAPAAATAADSTQSQNQSQSQSQSQSDASLLDDVDREASASVPAPMQALADPTQSGDADSASVSIQAATQNPAQGNN